MTESPNDPGSAAASASATTPADLKAPPLPRRMASWLYEGVLLFGVIIPAGLVFSVATQMRHALSHRLAFIAFLFVVIGIYCTFFWVRGQTLAMKTWRVRLVDRHGQRVTRGRAVLRYFFCWIWFLPPLAAFQARRVSTGEVAALLVGWVVFWALLSRLHPLRQFWHDAFAGTRLVEAPPPPPRRPRP
jgi:uncharacterized RDD family membrane protein YckC